MKFHGNGACIWLLDWVSNRLSLQVSTCIKHGSTPHDIMMVLFSKVLLVLLCSCRLVTQADPVHRPSQVAPAADPSTQSAPVASAAPSMVGAA
jgi:hypothetical protein